jgi:nucleoside-diphosphate-sugar epimerase
MQIGLIGGSGFVGSRFIEVMDRSQIRNIDKQESKLFPAITTLADVRNIDSLRIALKGIDMVVLLAAEHRDDVSPVSSYYDVNVQGMKNVLAVMDELGIGKIIFTSSVAVYGLNKVNPDENHPVDPFNHYGKSKWRAEEVLQEWYRKNPDTKSVTVIRPTVIFGERNRGNVYNLLRQIAGGKFMMIGSGQNKKSMAYVGNIVEFIKFNIAELKGYKTYIYTDSPDLTMNELLQLIENVLHKKLPAIKIPYGLGMLGGYCFDILAKITGKKLAVSSVRVRKFCATTQFNSTKAHQSGFKAPYTLSEGIARTLEYEFNSKKKDDITFESE